VFGHIVEIYDVNAAKKRIGDDTNKPIDKALKHVTNQEPPERPTLRFRLGAVNAVQSLLLNQAFIDGNKRVAFFVTDIFLRLNGWRFSVETTAAYDYIE
jgi:prophage maintenance system killer protein